jgi:hypothetical protein
VGSAVFVLGGNLSAVGTAANPILIDCGQVHDLINADGSPASALATLKHTLISSGAGLVEQQSGTHEASLHLTDSGITGMYGTTYLTYGDDEQILRDAFWDDGEFAVRNDANTQVAVFANDRFEGMSLSSPGPAALSRIWIEAIAGHASVNQDTFEPAGTVAVGIPPGDQNATIDATSNDWGTTDTSVIASMIYDHTQDITVGATIPFQPVLSGPDAATPPGTFFHVGVSVAIPNGPAPSVGGGLAGQIGSWGPTQGTTFSYQWLADGVPITGVSAGWTPTPDLIGKRLSVRVTSTRPGYATATATSQQTEPVIPGTLAGPTGAWMDGPIRVGSTVTGGPGGASINLVGVNLAYQWLANGAAIPGATHPTYHIPPSLLGRQLQVKITATRTGYMTRTVTSVKVTVAKGVFTVIVRPHLSGTTKVGATLHVTSGAWNPTATVTFQWLANNTPIAHATGHTLLLTSALRGKYISVVVTVRRPAYVTTTRHLSAGRIT